MFELVAEDQHADLTDAELPAHESISGSAELLANGLDFIADALGKIARAANAPRSEVDRLRKYALLHLASGAELVLKARLYLEHWTYVFANPNNADVIHLRSGRFLSVRASDLVARLNDRCGIQMPEDEAQALSALRDMRNRAEHFTLTENVHAVESVVKRAVPVIIDFIANHCGGAASHPVVMALLDDIRPLVTEVTENHDHAAAIAGMQAGAFEGTGGVVLPCPECAGRTLLIDGGAHCVLCDYQASGSDAAGLYVENVLGMSAYVTMKDGGVFPVHECPECEADSLVMNAVAGMAVCLTCGFTAEADAFTDCPSCGQMFRPGDEEAFICPACILIRWEREP